MVGESPSVTMKAPAAAVAVNVWSISPEDVTVNKTEATALFELETINLNEGLLSVVTVPVTRSR